LARGEGDLGGHALEDIEMDMHLGGAVAGGLPQGPGHFLTNVQPIFETPTAGPALAQKYH
jgi:hypothetical protein